jgi:hypothetical protein
MFISSAAEMLFAICGFGCSGNTEFIIHAEMLLLY